MKKKTITVFVSGSKGLVEHRVRLKALVNNLNGEFHMKGYPVNFAMYSFMNLGDNQQEYNDFIQNKTDVIVFVLEDKMGAKTKEEFLLAAKEYKKKGSPKMYVFLHDYAEETPAIQEIQQLVNDNCDSYYIDFTNLQELELKVGDRLKNEADKVMEKMNATPVKRMRLFRVWAFITTVFFLLCGGILLKDLLFPDNTLLFAGGGSIVTYIQQHYPEVGDINEYPNSVCVAIPSTLSWAYVTSDVLHHHGKRSNRVKNPFFPVSLSAQEADEDGFLELCPPQQFIKEGSALAYHMGDDFLTLFVKRSYSHALLDNKDTLSVEGLAQLINKTDLRMFCTREGSGTLNTYRSALAPYGVEISQETLGDRVEWFSNKSNNSKIRHNETPYMILGSQNYVPEDVYREGDCRGLIIVDEKGKPIGKSMYLYIAGYNWDDGENFWIPTEACTLLKKMDPRFKDVIHNNRIPRRYEKVIVSLNEYLKD